MCIRDRSEDALHAVPNSLREASYGVGATKFETATKVILPAALSGVAAAMVLAVSRAFGETMIVAIAAGAGPKLSWNPVSYTHLAGLVARRCRDAAGRRAGRPTGGRALRCGR